MITKLTIILIVLLSTAYRIVLGIVEMRSANNPTPANLADVYDAETYANWKRYSREKSRLSLIFTCIGAVLSLVLLATDAYARAASLFPVENWFMQLFSVIVLDLLVNLIPGIVRSYLFNMVNTEDNGQNVVFSPLLAENADENICANLELYGGLYSNLYNKQNTF